MAGDEIEELVKYLARLPGLGPRSARRAVLTLMRRREASINDVAIREADRRFHWSAPGPRPADDAGIPHVQ